MESKYSDLFEDEVSEILREAGPDAVIACGCRSWLRSHIADGYTNNIGLYAEYRDGRRYGSLVNVRYIALCLAHQDFTITTDDRPTVNSHVITGPFRVFDVNTGHHIFSMLDVSGSCDIPPDIAVLPVIRSHMDGKVLILEVNA